MKGLEVNTYTYLFNNFTNLFLGMVTLEDKNTEGYIWGLGSSVQGLVTTSRPSIFHSAKQLVYQLMEQCIR